ncbi:indc11-like protein [Purpureocillium lavendulum]|uniref:Indc11-like protein n=1 Tax=Purpureocillium lavendulum TaxID=1247861 RepID=A0AB34G2M5_9HYPO|nr:indc11-like protein [Purpureocillium lavendulum]
MVTAASTTRKVVVTAFGEPSVLTVTTSPMAAPARGEVQVRVLYSGFSGADVNMRMGTYPMQRRAPLTPGYCFVGRVADPNGSADFRPGDMVTAVTVYDSQSELINVPENYLTPVPKNLDIRTACALSLDWNTAYGMVVRKAKVVPGQRVFIHGLSGAVGYALLVLCERLGAIVYGTASERNHAALKARGAHPFVYTDKRWIEAMKDLGGAHVVFDALGYESFDESYAILSASEPSLLVGYGGNLGVLTEGKSRSPLPYVIKLMLRNLAFWSCKATTTYFITRDDKNFQPELRELMQLAQDGRIEVPIKQVWEMDDIQEAHRTYGKGAGMGSLLIRVANDASP